MSLKHTKVSAISDDGNTTFVQPSDWNADHVVDGDGLNMVTDADTPATPAAGKVVLWAHSGGRKGPAWIDEHGQVFDVQESLAYRKLTSYYSPGNGISNAAFGGTFTSSSTTSRSVIVNSNLFAKQRRAGYVTATTANANTSFRGPGSLCVAVGTGFLNTWRVGVSAYHAEMRAFVGLGAANSSYGSTSPGAQLNVIVFGFDPADTEWSLFHNDGSGTPTKVTLGASFPCNTNSVDVMEFTLYNPNGSGNVYAYACNLTSGATWSATISTDLPSSTSIAMQLHLSVVNGASATAVALDFMHTYLATEN